MGKTRFKNSDVYANGLGIITTAGVETVITDDAKSLVQTMAIAVADAATGNVDTVLDQDIKILDVFLVAGGTNGTNANTIQLKNGTTNAITDAMSMNGKVISDVVRAGQLVQARTAMSSGDTLRITRTKAGGVASCTVFVQYIAQ